MKATLMVMNAVTRKLKDNRTMCNLILAEPPKAKRLNAEFDFTLSDEQAQGINLEALIGKTLDFDLLSLNIYNGRLAFRGDILTQAPKA